MKRILLVLTALVAALTASAQIQFGEKGGYMTIGLESNNILYIDDAKVLCVRVYKSADGGDIGIFAVNTDAEFTNMTLRIPGE